MGDGELIDRLVFLAGLVVSTFCASLVGCEGRAKRLWFRIQKGCICSVYRVLKNTCRNRGFVPFDFVFAFLRSLHFMTAVVGLRHHRVRVVRTCNGGRSISLRKSDETISSGQDGWKDGPGKRMSRYAAQS